MKPETFAASGAAPSDSRRAFLKTSLVAGGAWVLGFRLSSTGAADASAPFAPDAFIRIERDGKVALIMPQVEMGQGVYTSIAMILAEELDADWSHVTLEHAPPNDALYGNPTFKEQMTGNSNSIRAFWMPLRKTAAAARAMLVEAAAKRWKVDASTCTAAASVVTHTPSGRKLGYGDLVADASRIEAPKDPPLKPVADFKLIGKPLKRLDTPGKTDGKAVYGIDAMPPGLKFATLKACPVFGGKVVHVDDTRAKAVPGVRQIVVLDDLVAVVGDHMWAAKKGLDALDITWDEGAHASVSTEDIWKALRAASEKEGLVAKTEGDAPKALADGDVVNAAYEMPFLAHATMEPLNCTAHVTADACEVWVGSQVLSRAHKAAAKASGLPIEKVTIHNFLLGGGFGRRLETDYVDKAVRIAKQVDAPVKVVYTREEDIRQDIYRPVYRDVMAAKLGADGRIDGWRHRVTGSSIMARFLPPLFTMLKGIDVDSVDAAVDMPYDIPNLRVEFQREEPLHVPTGFWRGVGPNNNVFAVESFIDELAKKAGKDPVEFRRGLLDKNPRLLAAVNLAAEKSGWGSPLPARTGRGICAQTAFASFIATVIEAEVRDDGSVKLRRIVCAVDTGIAVNPDTVIAQLQGGLVFGLSAALWGEITVDKGRVQQGNFNDYRVLRMDEVPNIEVHVMPSGEPPGGIGETGATAGPPALGNAIYAATGVRLRRMPVDRTLIARKTS